jgi:AcrR family transcriptional regulator
MRPPGRPRSFDPPAILRKIAAVFRRRGFSGTSLDDIAHAAGLNRPSLYAAFGDKRAMYLAALNMVADDIQAGADRIDVANVDLATKLEWWLKGALKAYLHGDPGPSGCLAIGTAPAEAVTDPEIRAALNGILTLIDTRVAAWFVEAGLSEPRVRAQLVAAVMHSLGVRARAGQPKAALYAFAANAVRLLAEP